MILLSQILSHWGDYAGDLGLIPGSGSSHGVGNGNPLQYSGLENSMGRGAWWATVHGVTKELDMTERARTHTHTHTHKDQHILISSSWDSISSSSTISAKAKSPSASHPPLLSCCRAYWKLRYVDLRWGEALLQIKWLKNSVKAAWSWKLNSSMVGPSQGNKNKKKKGQWLKRKK